MTDDVDRGVNDALGALAAETQGRQAPDRVEAALLREIRRRRAERRTGWLAMAAAAAVLMVISWAALRPGRPPESVAGRRQTTDFVPVAWAEPLRPEEDARIVRVRVPRAALVSYGLPVNQEQLADRIEAEVLLGEDSQVRAIRFER